MLEAMELTNGHTLDNALKAGAARWLPKATDNPDHVVNQLFQRSLSRAPSTTERSLALKLAGQPVTADGLEDVLWTLLMHPEFQLIR